MLCGSRRRRPGLQLQGSSRTDGCLCRWSQVVSITRILERHFEICVRNRDVPLPSFDKEFQDLRPAARRPRRLHSMRSRRHGVPNHCCPGRRASDECDGSWPRSSGASESWFPSARRRALYDANGGIGRHSYPAVHDNAKAAAANRDQPDQDGRTDGFSATGGCIAGTDTTDLRAESIPQRSDYLRSGGSRPRHVRLRHRPGR